MLMHFIMKKKPWKRRQRNKQWFRRSKSFLEAGGVLHDGSWRLESSWLPSCVCDSWFQLPNAGEWMQHSKHVSLLLFCYLKTLSVISLSNMRFVGSKMSIFHRSQRWLSPQAVPAGLSLGWMMLQSWQTFLQWFCIERGQNRKGLCSLLHWQHAEGWNSPRTDLLFLADWGWVLVPEPKQSTSTNICAWYSSNLAPDASYCQENCV